ncbi:MAG: PIG-L family deacetylase [Blastocatellia bacterium]|nr:PIG-L family deacetylase [Blastocatellia bacterium]
MIKQIFLKAFAFVVLTAVVIAPTLPISAQVRPQYDRGAAGLGQKLKRLQTTASIMLTAAHPDDEDSGLMSYMARKVQARTSYYSVTRGDGGQNVIGNELSEALGVIRTEELLQARRLDGADQFFGSALDYGFSKDLDEARRMWDERRQLGDMVRAIRLHRPMVLVSRFSGQITDGHGQHQMSGFLTPLAFAAAGDATQFPEQLKEGLEPWQPLKFYRSGGFGQTPQGAVINTGEFDKLIGRTYFEIAMEGRSQHKSQEMGVLELRGAQRSGAVLVESRLPKAAADTEFFDGIDTTITGIPAITGDNNPALAKALTELQQTAEAALREYDPFAPEKLIPTLARGYGQADAAITLAGNAATRRMLTDKRRDFAEALQAAASVVVDALADAEIINPGGSVAVAARVFAPEGSRVRLLGAQLLTPTGWQVKQVEEPPTPAATGFRPRTEISTAAAFFSAQAPADAAPTQPYWLERPLQGAEFDWSTAGSSAGLPFGPDVLRVRSTLEIGGRQIDVETPVQYRFADDIRGEIRRAVNVVPAVTLSTESDLLIAPRRPTPTNYPIKATLRSNSPTAIEGTVGLELPAGWISQPASTKFNLARAGERQTAEFTVTVPANANAGTHRLGIAASSGSTRFNQAMQEIAYPHIQTHRIFTDAAVRAEVLNLSIPKLSVGYVMGSGDRVPEALRRMGVDVTLLGANDLATGDLSRFNAIMLGIRATQVRQDVAANNARLLAFAESGGTLIVQYQQSDYTQAGLAPFPAEISNVMRGNQRFSNIRTTDPNAAVNILEPSHPIFNTPNKIVQADWDGWVQERSLYCLTKFDERFTPLLDTFDPGEEENKGCMVYAPVGSGHYIYSSMAWFRQLPAGVPGAYRLVANMLSLSANPR